MTIDQVKQRAKACGSHFFDKGTMRFFAGRVSNKTHRGTADTYFVTSEQFKGSVSSAPRKFTVRRFDEDKCNIKTVGEFQQYKTAAQAHAAAKRAAASGLSGARRRRKRRR